MPTYTKWIQVLSFFFLMKESREPSVGSKVSGTICIQALVIDYPKLLVRKKGKGHVYSYNAYFTWEKKSQLTQSAHQYYHEVNFYTDNQTYLDDMQVVYS